MTIKQAALEAIRQLPDDTTLPEIMSQHYFLRKVEQGQHQLDAGQELEHVDVKQMLARWLHRDDPLAPA